MCQMRRWFPSPDARPCEDQAVALWLIGCGAMAKSYFDVLAELGVGFQVIGRSQSAAAAFEAEKGFPVVWGGLELALRSMTPPEQAIVAVGPSDLAGAASSLLEAGCRRILLEKPGGLDSSEIGTLAQVSESVVASVLVAYNRRYYGSVTTARRLIADDGGVSSLRFEFGEKIDAVLDLRFAEPILNRWFLMNSSHVVDLAFHLAGRPSVLNADQSGSLDWHPSGAVFSGTGKTEVGVPFSYKADWRTSSTWGLEIETRRRLLRFRSLETLTSTVDGTEETMPPENDFDRLFKPGLYRQVEAFLAEDDRLACTVAQQASNSLDYDRMAGYVGGR